MSRMTCLLVSLVLGLSVAGCAVTAESECSCAAGTTFRGTFYNTRPDVVVDLGAPIGTSDVNDCCGTSEDRQTVYAVKGIGPDLAVATTYADGEVALNVAGDLSDADQAVADRFVAKHRGTG